MRPSQLHNSHPLQNPRHFQKSTPPSPRQCILHKIIKHLDSIKTITVSGEFENTARSSISPPFSLAFTLTSSLSSKIPAAPAPPLAACKRARLSSADGSTPGTSIINLTISPSPRSAASTNTLNKLTDVASNPSSRKYRTTSRCPYTPAVSK
ncbi:hypothetical protein BC829DRAFT_220788 [Chytridium lagenaria]|nr:hypothetical protein BC829DRAFT_220788 [Chytridium lagenaria]